MRHLAIAALISALPCAGFAQQGCFGVGVPLMHCTLKGGAKTLDICLQGNVAFYRFGPKGGVAELLLASTVEEVHLTPWNGIGSSIYEELEFWAGDITYQVHRTVDRIAADNPNETGGVVVFRADETLAQLSCDEGSVESADFYPLYEAKERAGQCYSPESFMWSPC